MKKLHLKKIEIKLVAVLFLGIWIISCTERNIPPKKPDKVLIFGIDAASWKVIDPLLDKGYLPNLNELIKTGARANLKTLEPTVSVMLWTTIATGRLPENHGISSWLSEGVDTSGQLAITSNMRRAPALWNLKSDLKYIFSNWWATWPAEKINGVMISNRAHFPGLQKIVYPSELSEFVKSTHRLSRQEIETELISYNPYKTAISISDFTFSQIQKDRFYLDATANVMATMRFDLVGLFVRGIDILEHEYLQDVLVYPNAPSLKSDKKGIVIAYYRYLDYQIQRFSEMLGSHCGIIIVSDHGMEPVVETPPVVEGLQLDRVLAFADIVPTDDSGNLVLKNAEFQDNKQYPPGLIRGIKWNRKLSEDSIHPDKQFTILKNQLNALMVGNENLFSNIDQGDGDSEFITLTINKDVELKSDLRIGSKRIPLFELITLIVHPRAGQHWHSPDGIFIINGPGIQHNEFMQDISITDVAPTLAYYLDLPVSDQLDGTLQTNFFSTRFLNSQPIQRVPAYPTRNPTDAEFINNDVENTIKNELRILGYIQ